MRTQWSGAVLAALALACQVAAADAPAAPSWKWGGDVRLRADIKTFNHGANKEAVNTRLRVGASGATADGKVSWGAQVATAAGKATSRNVDIGGGNLGGKPEVGVDLAWFAVHPSKRISLVLGKMKNPFTSSDAIFDGDLTPEGIAVNCVVPVGGKSGVVKKLSNSAAYFVLDSTSPFKGVFLGDQLRATLGPVDTALAIYHFNKVPSIGGITVVDARAAAALPTGKAFPVTLSGEFFHNISEKNRASAWELRADLAKVGPGKANLTYRQVGLNSTYSAWVDSDLGERTGYKTGLRAEYSQPVYKAVVLRAAWYHYDPMGNGVKSTNRFMVDASTKF